MEPFRVNDVDPLVRGNLELPGRILVSLRLKNEVCGRRVGIHRVRQRRTELCRKGHQ